MKNEPLVVERVYEASAAKVWKALTDPSEMKQWYFDLQGFRAEVGCEFEFTASCDEKKTYRHLCRITEGIDGKRLAYTWRYEGYEGDSLVTFELIPEGGKTRLRLIHRGLETFPSSDPAFAPKNFEAGWNHILGESLKSHLDK